MSEREKYAIESLYYDATTGQLEKGIQTYEQWILSYPRDFVPHSNLGNAYILMGQWDKALPEGSGSCAPGAQQSRRISATSRRTTSRSTGWTKPRNMGAGVQLEAGCGLSPIVDVLLAFLRGDSADMEQQVAWGAGKPGAEDPMLSAQSDTEAYFGRLTKARDFSRRAVDSALRSDSKETAALWQVNAALREAQFGNFPQAKRDVASALAMSHGRDVKVLAALTLALSGDKAGATAMVQELEKSNPANTVIKVYWAPTLRAAIELEGANPSQALVFLEAAAPYELGEPPPTSPGTLYPPYLRGQAQLMLRNGAAAATEFQKLLDHPGIVANFPLGSLARLQIARAYSLSGNAAKAKTYYQDFFTLWKDADPDIPILKEAKTEYSKLQ